LDNNAISSEDITLTFNFDKTSKTGFVYDYRYGLSKIKEKKQSVNFSINNYFDNMTLKSYLYPEFKVSISGQWALGINSDIYLKNKLNIKSEFSAADKSPLENCDKQLNINTYSGVKVSLFSRIEGKLLSILEGLFDREIVLYDKENLLNKRHIWFSSQSKETCKGENTVSPTQTITGKQLKGKLNVLGESINLNIEPNNTKNILSKKFILNNQGEKGFNWEVFYPFYNGISMNVLDSNNQIRTPISLLGNLSAQSSQELELEIDLKILNKFPIFGGSINAEIIFINLDSLENIDTGFISSPQYQQQVIIPVNITFKPLPPATPELLNINLIGQDNLQLEWDFATEDTLINTQVDNIEIYIQDSDSWKLLDIVNVSNENKRQYITSNLQMDRNYAFKLKSSVFGSSSNFSNRLDFYIPKEDFVSIDEYATTLTNNNNTIDGYATTLTSNNNTIEVEINLEASNSNNNQNLGVLTPLEVKDELASISTLF